jgi:hypothetical protein
MPNIYYSQSIKRGSCILRAVLSWEEGRSLLKLHSVHYAGQQFPTTDQGRAADFAILRIFEEELDEDWRAGFYHFDADIMRIEEALQACTEQAKRQILKCPRSKIPNKRKAKWRIAE